jgi:hypothetical protein
MERYKVIESNSSDELQRLVNLEIDKGYIPYGSLVIVSNSTGFMQLFYQPVYLEHVPS